jgi:phosphatidylinositol 4-phosphatase
MPFLWEQIVDLTYKPGFDVVRVEEAVSCVDICFIQFY